MPTASPRSGPWPRRLLPRRPCPPVDAGFTLIEMMAVLAVIAILATMALPGLQARLVRQQIIEAVKLAEIAKPPIEAAWRSAQPLPADNGAAGLPPPDKVVSNLVAGLSVEGGALQLRFGNQAQAAIRGRVLSLRPAVVEGAPVVPIAWVCGHAEAPANMTAIGTDRTDVRADYLPLNCLASGGH